MSIADDRLVVLAVLWLGACRGKDTSNGNNASRRPHAPVSVPVIRFYRRLVSTFRQETPCQKSLRTDEFAIATVDLNVFDRHVLADGAKSPSLVRFNDRANS